MYLERDVFFWKFFTTNTHFAHEKNLRLANRTVETLVDMEEATVKNWNGKVNNSDDIYIIGNFMYLRSDSEENRILK